MVVPAKNNTLSLPLIPSFGGWRLQPLGRQPLRLTHLPKHTLTIHGLQVEVRPLHLKDVPPVFMGPLSSLSVFGFLIGVSDGLLQFLNDFSGHGVAIKAHGWRLTLANPLFQALKVQVSDKA